jgi:glucose-6-phosphate isomerase
MKVQLKPELAAEIQPVIQRIVEERIASRIAAKDDSIWGPDSQPEASIRLGWVTSPRDSVELIPEIIKLRDAYVERGIDRFVLCGMGGSSLAPEVITRYSKKDLFILDSTAPDQVRLALRDLQRTALIVSSKSGSTVETDSQKRTFEQAFSDAGIDPTDRIVIVTDPGSPLDQASRQAGYTVFNADSKVGGRYSALTAFGLVPAGLAGCDIAGLLHDAASALPELATDSADNPAIALAAALAGRSQVDKFLIESDVIPSFGDWVEQLVAESTGKNDGGVLPVAVSNAAPELNMQLKDTLSVRYAVDGADVSFAGELGGLFVLWEYATAMAGWLLKINPFDQPNVESAKVAARKLLDDPSFTTQIDFVDRSIAVTARGFQVNGSTVEAAVESLLSQLGPDGYLSIHAYLPASSYPQFIELRDIAATRTQRPVTFGWGPRFLHSTGQYHKGGPKQGVFLQLTQGVADDISIPGREFSFGQLISAQAKGDAEVLASHNLPVLSLQLTNPLEALNLLEGVIRS